MESSSSRQKLFFFIRTSYTTLSTKVHKMYIYIAVNRSIVRAMHRSAYFFNDAACCAVNRSRVEQCIALHIFNDVVVVCELLHSGCQTPPVLKKKTWSSLFLCRY